MTMMRPRDVQAAINGARGYLPSNLPNNPRYRKYNPADSPIFMISLTSDIMDKGQMFDAASSIMAQSVKGSVADDLIAKGIQDVRSKLN